MKISGGCYCRNIRYEINSEPETSFQCHCRECQYITGGNPNIVMVFPKNSFSYTSGKISKFSRKDLDAPVVRHFCNKCGTAIGTESPSRPDSMIVKVYIYKQIVWISLSDVYLEVDMLLLLFLLTLLAFLSCPFFGPGLSFSLVLAYQVSPAHLLDYWNVAANLCQWLLTRNPPELFRGQTMAAIQV